MTPIHPYSTYTPELGEKICEMLESGMSLKAISREPGMPNTATVVRWTRRIPEFAEQYNQARKNQLELIADGIRDIAADDSQDILPDGKPNNAKVQRDRLKIDTDKFLLVHLMPDKYGNAFKQEISGPNGGPILTTQVPKEELARWVAFQLSQGEKE